MQLFMVITHVYVVVNIGEFYLQDGNITLETRHGDTYSIGLYYDGTNGANDIHVA